MFLTCVILHVEIIYGVVSVGRESNFSYIKAPKCHFWSDDITSVTDRQRLTMNGVGLAHEHN